jgi:hypothetical protein
VTEEQEDAAYASQAEWLKRHFPNAHVNSGWAVDEVEEEIATKVYGHGVLVTHVPTLEHTFYRR